MAVTHLAIDAGSKSSGVANWKRRVHVPGGRLDSLHHRSERQRRLHEQRAVSTPEVRTTVRQIKEQYRFAGHILPVDIRGHTNDGEVVRWPSSGSCRDDDVLADRISGAEQPARQIFADDGYVGHRTGS